MIQFSEFKYGSWEDVWKMPHVSVYATCTVCKDRRQRSWKYDENHIQQINEAFCPNCGVKIVTTLHDKIDEIKFCANEEMAAYILEFIQRGYKENYNDNGVKKYIEALQMGIDALNLVKTQKEEIKKLSALYDRSIECIYDIDDHLRRGTTNDWAVEEIQDWEEDISKIRTGC